VDTDYDNWAVVYACSDIIPGIWKMEYAWVLTRKPLVPGTKEFDEILLQTRKVFSD
jgi:hypothetical protein